MSTKSASSSSSSSSSSTSTQPNPPHSDESRWRVIYPVYLNRNKRLSEGRKVPLKYAIEHPLVQDIVEVCRMLNLPCKAELNKAYCRDFMTRGRVRVMMRNDDGTLLHPDLPTRQHLLIMLGERIPTLASRPARLAAHLREEESIRKMLVSWGEQQRQSAKQEAAAAAAAAAGGSVPGMPPGAVLKKKRK